ncbi:MAG: CheR family methyltransferase [Actinophytocola sp.]|uniref:CheR family methyltransferase n=1 Tax=Actinophytocola sp. TaxID=1872138 RepID=UPI003D6B016C
MPADLVGKYFDRHGASYVFRKDLRRSVIFGRNDLVQDAPISRIDLLVCRNTLMYFNAETQSRVVGRFHFAIAPHGLLFLGKAEMLLSHTRIFDPLDLKWRVFREAPGRSARRRAAAATHVADRPAGRGRQPRPPARVRLREPGRAGRGHLGGRRRAGQQAG